MPLRSLLAASLLLPLAAVPAPAQDVVEPATAAQDATDPLALARGAALRGDAAEALAHYLRALSRSPRDLEALTGAGRASLDLDDPDSAIAFYARAEEVSPRNGRVKAGLGSAMVAQRNPRAALRFFSEAAELGVPAADIAADRGLAYDLRGDGRRAQADYRVALSARDDPETVRRLAISQAIGGGRDAALLTLDPLLRRQDIPAWRVRAFVFAVTGDTAEAQKAAAMVMPRQQAQALGPFLVRIAALKPAGQAAAVHFGYLPQEKRSTAAAAPPSPVPPAAIRSAAPVLQQTPSAGTASLTPVLTGSAATTAAIRPSSPILPRAAASTSAAPVRTDADRAVATPLPSPGTVQQSPVTAKSAVESGSRAASVEPRPSTPSPAAEPKTETAAKPKPPAKKPEPEPDRYWAQVAGGANAAGLPKAWAAVRKAHPALLKGRQAWTTHYRFTNRILVGPFKTDDEAQAFVNKAAGDDLSAFTVRTGGSDVVTRLATAD